MSPPDFVSEELPPDFWDDEAAPRTAAASVAPSRPTPPPTALDREAPLFDQLKQLFPGRVVRVEPLETVDKETDEALADEDEVGEDIVQNSLFD